MALFKSRSEGADNSDDSNASRIPESEINATVLHPLLTLQDLDTSPDFGVPHDEEVKIDPDKLHPIFRDENMQDRFTSYGDNSHDLPVNPREFMRTVQDRGIAGAAAAYGEAQARLMEQHMLNVFGIRVTVSKELALGIALLDAGYRLHKHSKRHGGIKQYVRNVTNRFVGGFLNFGGGGGSGGGSGSGGGIRALGPGSGDGSDDTLVSGLGPAGSGGYFNYTRLSLESDPVEVRLVTGIKPNTFTPDYESGENGYYSPLHLSFVKLGLPSATPTDANSGKFLNTSVMTDLINVIQRNITFSPLSGTVNPTSLTNALDKLIQALSVYYCIDRLLVYGDNPMNKNEALLYMRSQITSSVGDSFMRLKRLLQGTPIPPNLNAIVFWFYQIYMAQDVPGSSLIMNSAIAMDSSVPTFTEIDTAITQLNAYIDQYAVLGRAIPTWYSTPLLTGISTPLHDPNFTTVWANLPYMCSGTSPTVYTKRLPAYGSVDTNIFYATYAENLDGGAFALMNAFDATGTYLLPGLVAPFECTVYGGSNKSSRVSWVDSTNLFRDPMNHTSIFVARDEVYWSNSASGDGRTANLGSARCWGVTPRVISDCTNQLLDWMMSWDTIPSPNYNNLNLSSPKPKQRRRRRRGKGKG